MNHCCTQLQKAFKGFHFRKNILPGIKLRKKAETVIKAFGKAWRIRKIF